MLQKFKLSLLNKMMKQYLYILLICSSYLNGKGQPSSFYNSAASYSVGSSPGGMCTADFNGDGKADIAVTKYGSINFSYTSYVIIFTNNGNGTFTPSAQYYNLGSRLRAICTADFNNDGKADLALTRDDSTSIIVMINNGVGNFSQARYAAGVQPFDICSADFNGDGSKDLAITTDDSLVSVLINNGSGAFALPLKYASGRWSMKICTADFNNDGMPDLATTLNYNNYSIGVLINTGGGSFLAPITYSVGASPKGICGADLNNDGKVDLAVANYHDNNVSVLMNAGNGSFNTAVNYFSGYYAGSLCSLDINGDGNLDLAVPSAGSDKVSLLINAGIGTFGAAITYTTGSFPTHVCSNDFNGDGKPDIAVINEGITYDLNVLLSTAESLNLDGVNDYVQVNTPVDLPIGNAPRTIEGWIKTTNTGTDVSIVNYGVLSNNERFGLSVNGSGYVNFVAGNNDLLGNTPVNDNNWHHIAVVYSGGVNGMLSLYVDGVLDASAIKNLNTAGTGNLRIGAGIGSSVNEFFNGTIDEIRIWNRALCLLEIQNNMNKELLLPQSGLVSYYQFNRGSSGAVNSNITTLTDAIGTNQGTLINLALSGITSNWISPGALSTGNYALPFASPTVSLNVSANSICNGASASLTAGGNAVTFSWSTGATTTSISVSPTVNTIYTVTGTDINGCTANAISSISVNPIPTVTVNSGTICSNQSFVINPSGANTYTYSSGSNTVSPVANSTYTITGTDLNGCVNSIGAISTVSVNATPIVTAQNASVCVGTSTILNVSGANTYSWTTGATTASMSVSPTTTTTYSVTGTSLNNCSSTQTVAVTVNPNCQDVWPGDANSDGTADNFDVLELGLHFTQIGPARASTSNAWQAHFASNWTGTISNGKNVNHSDCNGDGTIDSNDTLAIFNNYGLTHTFKQAEQIVTNPQLRIVPDQNAVSKGSWGTASVFLGEASAPVTNINGLAFTLTFDQNLIDANSFYIEYPTSFINAANQNLKFQKPDFANGKLYTATTHTNNTNVSGNGRIATLHYKIKSTLATDEVLNIGITQTKQSNAAGVLTPLTAGTATVAAIGASVGMDELSNGNSIGIYPNPANSSVTIHSSTPLEKVELLSITGQVVSSEKALGNQHQLDLTGIANGVYFVNVYTTDEKVARKKLVVQR
jgi:hypothetical protein